MLAPEALLRHARRLLDAAVDEADLRRVISAAYYAVFDHFITGAAATQTGVSDAVRGRIRRSIDHGEVRKVCAAISTRPGARPAPLQGLLTEPVDPGLLVCATNFVQLQDARLVADYDLDLTFALPFVRQEAEFAVALAQAVFDTWHTLASDPNTQIFLSALLFHSRWTRRP